MKAIRKTQPLDFTKVRIDDQFWKPRMETNRKVTLPLEYRICKKTGRIDAWKWKPGHPFQPHIFWDSDVAKWMEAAAYSLAVYPDRSLEKKLDAVIAMMAKTQLPDGYLNSHYIRVEPGKRWTNLKGCHELYCAGHLMEAAAAYFNATGRRRFLDIMCRYADYIEATFGRAPGKKRGYCGHEEIELALIKLYKATDNRRYLKLSKFFIDERGRQPHYFDVETKMRGEPGDKNQHDDVYQAHVPVRKQTTAEGHAVRAMYLYAGMADVAAETGDMSLLKACRKLWRNVTEHRMYVTGGVGSYADGERFSFDYDLPNEEAYTETCAAIGLVFWAHRMLNLEPDRRYADVMERALYNGVLSSVSLAGRHFFYNNPLAVYPAKCHFEQRARRTGGKYVAPTRQRWFGTACCPPNIARLLASFGEYLYSFNDREIYVHLYVQSRAEMTVAGEFLSLVQKTNYPWDGKIKIIIQPPINKGASEKKKINFTLALRIPAWCRNYSLRVNGKAAKVSVSSCGYAELARSWQFGDEIELALPMPIEKIEAHPSVRHNCGRAALQRGPLVYCLEETDNGPDLNDINLARDPRWKIKLDHRLLGGIPVIMGQAVRRSGKSWKNRLYQPGQALYEKTTIKAVPYCLWNNRGEGEMLVWIRKEH